MSTGADTNERLVEDEWTKRLTGQNINGFELIELVGAGGMGLVFRARQLSVDRIVAVKVVADSGNSTSRGRFLREAKAIGRLNHPNVVQLIEAGEHLELGVMYYAMEYIDGWMLRWLLGQGRVHPALAIEVAIQVSSALVQTHAAGIVHRDLKASNILVSFTADRQLRVKILDFGVAHTVADEDHRLTKTGLICGTPAYLAPEQVESDDPTALVDLYALGVNLYYMLRGRLPHVGRNALDLVVKQLKSPTPTLTEYVERGLLPAGLSALAERLMQKSPADRPQSAQEVLSELRRLRTELNLPAPDFAAGSADELLRFVRPRTDQEGEVPLDWRFDGEPTTPMSKEDVRKANEEPPAILMPQAMPLPADASASAELPQRGGADWGAFNEVTPAPDAARPAYEFEPHTGPYKPVSSNPGGGSDQDATFVKLAAPSGTQGQSELTPLEKAQQAGRRARVFTDEELVVDLPARNVVPPPVAPREGMSGKVIVGALLVFALSVALVFGLLTEFGADEPRAVPAPETVALPMADEPVPPAAETKSPKKTKSKPARKAAKKPDKPIDLFGVGDAAEPNTKPIVIE